MILNNVLKVPLDIVENVFFPERAAARASTTNSYIIPNFPCASGKPSFENLINASWNSILVDARHDDANS